MQKFRRMKWSDFRSEILDGFTQSQHVGMIGPTGRGKSTLGMHLLRNRPYVVVLDAKGGDSTLEASGFEVVEDWPIPNEEDRLKSGKPIRVMLRPRGYGRERLDNANRLFSKCIEGCLMSRRWTVYIDELRLTSEGRTIDLAPEIEVAYMTGRGREVSFISAAQAPRWVPIASHEQAVHQFHWPLYDRYALSRQAEISGLGRDRFFALAAEMTNPHDVMYVLPPDLAVITRPPKLRAPRVVAQGAAETGPPVSESSSRLKERLWK
jgi:hypothetical protein